MRVLHITEAPLGGVVACLDELLVAQAKAPNVESILVLTPEINLSMLKAEKYDRVQIATFTRNERSIRTLLRLSSKTMEHVRQYNPDVIHLHSTLAGAVVRCRIGWKRRRPAIVYCPHGWAFSRRGHKQVNRAVVLVERFLSRFCEKIICVSEHEKVEAVAAGIPESKCQVIQNGIRPHAAASRGKGPARQGPKVIVFAGRFDRQKGYDVFLDVMRKLGGQAQGYAIGGQIVSSEDLPDMPPNVEALGWQTRESVLESFLQADLLLMPSRWEGFPIVALEAMQAELAVFASRVGGLQDIVVDGETGRLFEPDDVEQIVKLIEGTDRDRLRAYGLAGRARYEMKHTAQVMNDSTLSLYRELTQAVEA